MLRISKEVHLSEEDLGGYRNEIKVGAPFLFIKWRGL